MTKCMAGVDLSSDRDLWFVLMKQMGHSIDKIRC